MLLPDQTYEAGAGPRAPALLALLRAHRVPPDFFCANRPRRTPTSRRCPPGDVTAQAPPLRAASHSTSRRRSTKHNDASSSNEAVHLQRRLLSLSSELVTLRSHLHVGALPPAPQPAAPAPQPAAPAPQPAVPPRAPHLLPPAPLPTLQPLPPPPETRWRGGGGPSAAADVEDLIHLRGPLTEDAVVRALQARFYQHKCYTMVGPILVAVNAYTDASNALTLSAARAQRPELARLVHHAVRHQADSGYPQAIILSGVSGSGKTYASMVLLRRLFDVAGGGPETDAFKHLAAAFTVLRALGTAATPANSNSSRIGHFIEVQVTDGALYRTKIHCYFLEQTRVVRPPPAERNYHIFYHMLAGLTAEERAQLHLDGYTPQDLRYLASPQPRRPEPEDAARFRAWKTCLVILGIPFLDVVRVLAAVLLLGNVQFVSGGEGGAEPAGEAELAAAAALLGVPAPALLRGLPRAGPRAGPRARHARRRARRARRARPRALLPHRGHHRAPRQLPQAARLHARHALLRLQRLGAQPGRSVVAAQLVRGGGRRSRSGGRAVDGGAQRRGAARDRRVRGDPGHVRVRGRGALAARAAVRQPVRGDHAALLQHARVQVVRGVVPRGGRARRARAGLRGQRALHRPRVQPARRAAGRARRRVRRARLARPVRGAHPARAQGTPAAGGGAPAAPAPVRRAALRRRGGVRRGRLPGGQPRRRAGRAARRVRGARLRVRVRHAPVRRRAEGARGRRRRRRVLPRLAHRRARLHLHAGLPHAARQPAAHAGARAPALRALPARQRHRDAHAVRARHRRQAGARAADPGDDAADGERVPAPHAVPRVRHAVPGAVGAGRAGAGRGRGRGGGVRRGVRGRAARRAGGRRAARARLARHRRLGARQAARLPQRGDAAGDATRRAQVLERMRRARRAAAAECIQAAWRRHRSRPRGPAAPAPAPARPRPAPIAGTPPPEGEGADKCEPALVKRTCSLFGLDLERPPPLPPPRAYTVAGGVKLGYPQQRLVTAEWAEEGGAARLRPGDSVLVVGAARRGHVLVQVPGRAVCVPHAVLAPPRAPAPRAPPAPLPPA